LRIKLPLKHMHRLKLKLWHLHLPRLITHNWNPTTITLQRPNRDISINNNSISIHNNRTDTSS
jgi:hypothetical protein